MTYASYLNDRSSECVSLAVAQPWAADVDQLIDLAIDYRSWARQVGEPERAAETGRTGTIRAASAA